MSGVKYHGEYPLEQVDGEGKPFIEHHGYVFHPGETVAVKDDHLLAKFAANRFFKVAGKSDKEAAEAGEDEAERAQIVALRAWLSERGVPTHHKSGLDKLQAQKAEYEKAQEEAEA